jgi:transposase
MADDVVYVRAAGVDISKRDAKVCVRVLQAGRVRPRLERAVFGSTMAEVRRLRAWLEALDPQIVVMESTSAYWKTFYYGLEDGPWRLALSNPHHVKALRGRKTDVADAAWLAKLGSLDMAPSSFAPRREQRDLRLVTRAREKAVRRRTQVVNGLEKTLEDTRMKLASVGGLLSVSARDILREVAAGRDDPRDLAKLSQFRKVRGQELIDMLEGEFRDAHRFVIQAALDEIGFLDAMIERMDQMAAALAEPFAEATGLLARIGGIGELLARGIVAECGPDMSEFPTPEKFSAWAGLAPGSNQSASRSKPAKCRKGNNHLKRLLSQAARVAASHPGTFYCTRFNRVARNAGKAKAFTAVAHSLARTVWKVLASGQPFQDLGADHYDKSASPQARERQAARLEARASKLRAISAAQSATAPTALV